MSKFTILMIGNYLTHPKFNKNVWHFLAEKLAEHDWQIITTSSKVNQFLRLIDMLVSIWRHRKTYQLAQIDVFSGKAFIIAQCCSWLLKMIHKPIVLTLHGGGLVGFAESHTKQIKRVFERATKIVTPSPFLQLSLKSFHENIIFIPNPIEISDAIFRVRLNPKPILIWVRAFHQIYNPMLVVKLASLLSTDFPNLEFLMIGPDKGDGSLARVKNEITSLGLERQFKFIGGVKHDEIPTWLDKADIFINTTNFDAAPRSVLEAMANGLCVVSTNVGGVPYIIENGKEGLLVPPDDPKAMAEAIKEILIDSPLSSKLSTNAHCKASLHDWSVVLPQWEDLFMSIIGENS